jgi:hypothetical protein
MLYIAKLFNNNVQYDLETLVDMELLLVQSCVPTLFAVTLSQCYVH